MYTKEEMSLIRDGLSMLLGVMNATGNEEKADKVESLIRALQYEIRYSSDEE